MTATEAKEITASHADSLFSKINLIWACGILNGRIRSAAKHGNHYASYYMAPDKTKLRTAFAQIYRDLGYEVNDEYLDVSVFWG